MARRPSGERARRGAAQGLSLSIQRQQGPESHLADDGWRRTEAWLLPERVEPPQGRAGIPSRARDLRSPGRHRHCAAARQEPDIGVVGSTVIAWPAMLTSGAVDPSSRLLDDTVRLRRPNPLRHQPNPQPSPKRQPEPELPPPLPPPLPNLRASRALDPGPPERSGAAGWLIARRSADRRGRRGLLRLHDVLPETRTRGRRRTCGHLANSERAGQIRARHIVGEYFATKPPPEAMLAKARDYAKSGEMAAAFLVFRSRRRNRQCARPARGRDLLRSADTCQAGFTPDGARAAEWYERAALAARPKRSASSACCWPRAAVGF